MEIETEVVLVGSRFAFVGDLVGSRFAFVGDLVGSRFAFVEMRGEEMSDVFSASH